MDKGRTVKIVPHLLAKLVNNTRTGLHSPEPQCGLTEVPVQNLNRMGYAFGKAGQEPPLLPFDVCI